MTWKKNFLILGCVIYDKIFKLVTRHAWKLNHLEIVNLDFPSFCTSELISHLDFFIFLRLRLVTSIEFNL